MAFVMQDDQATDKKEKKTAQYEHYDKGHQTSRLASLTTCYKLSKFGPFGFKELPDTIVRMEGEKEAILESHQFGHLETQYYIISYIISTLLHHLILASTESQIYLCHATVWHGDNDHISQYPCITLTCKYANRDVYHTQTHTLHTHTLQMYTHVHTHTCTPHTHTHIHTHTGEVLY